MKDSLGHGYWTARRASRRRVLRGAALGLAGVALAGCTASTETATTAPVPTSAAAASPTRAAGAAPAATAARTPKLGGTFKTMGTSSEPNLDPHMESLRVTGGLGALICYS